MTETNSLRDGQSVKPIWYDDPRTFKEVIEGYDNHDKTCLSLRFIHVYHHGGVSDMMSQERCDHCRVTFDNEGLVFPEYMGLAPGFFKGSKDEDPYALCACCAIKSGLTVSLNARGELTY